MLAPLRACIFREPVAGAFACLPMGRYVVGYKAHFLPVRIHFRRWVRVPCDCAIFRVYLGEEAAPMIERMMFAELLTSDRVSAREEMATLAGHIFHQQISWPGTFARARRCAD